MAVVDVQAYSTLTGADLQREILQDVLGALARDAKRVASKFNYRIDTQKLLTLSNDLATDETSVDAAVPQIKRELQSITTITKKSTFVFLDDFHLLELAEQPKLLHLLHGALKGANGWLKVAGLRSLLNYYSATTRQGLQVPVTIIITLDLTLENPVAAETHLRAILGSFLEAVGYSVSGAVLPEQAFRRLAWATAGVPRDFLQMFGRAVEHARRNKRAVVTLSDVNVAIGEFGEGKMDELRQDARNLKASLSTCFLRLKRIASMRRKQTHSC